MSTDIALSTTLRGAFDDVVTRTREALADNGFGVLTEIDMKATMTAKVGEAAGEALGDYVILGACNPPLAQRAVMIDRQIGLLLPCNVVVRSDPDRADTIHVEAMNPQLLVGVTGQAELQPVADEVTEKLQSAIDSLSAS
jgi:uncharacterized protein (DUF302 family)